jgi:hypothetical protein
MCNPLREANERLERARAEYHEALKPGNLEATLVCVAIDKLFQTRQMVCRVRYNLEVLNLERQS